MNEKFSILVICQPCHQPEPDIWDFIEKKIIYLEKKIFHGRNSFPLECDVKLSFPIEMDISGQMSNNLISSVVFLNKTAADWVGRRRGNHV